MPAVTRLCMSGRIRSTGTRRLILRTRMLARFSADTAENRKIASAGGASPGFRRTVVRRPSEALFTVSTSR